MATYLRNRPPTLEAKTAEEAVAAKAVEEAAAEGHSS